MAQATPLLWTEKYQPRQVAHLVGNIDVAQKLGAWLEAWVRGEASTTRGRQLPPAAALLSGPPGVGKTSIAILVAKQQAYDVVVLNASDKRSKAELEKVLQGVTAAGGKHRLTHLLPAERRLVIMDEVDGMGGNKDRGGLQVLMKTIRDRQVPVMCICNDRHHQKVRTLARVCLDLRCSRADPLLIVRRAHNVASREGLHLEPEAIRILVESSGRDIRQVLTCLQMWSAVTTPQKVTAADVRTRLAEVRKDRVLRLTPFDGAKELFHPARFSLDERHEDFFLDYGLVPLLLQQNYVDAITELRGRGDSRRQLAACEEVSEALSDLDVLDSQLRRDNDWTLLPFEASLAVRVGSLTEGHGVRFPTFPAWLGKNSTHTKRRRLLAELCAHLQQTVARGSTAVRLDYLQHLHQHLREPLQSSGAAGAEECVRALVGYSLTRDDLFESLPEFEGLLGVRGAPVTGAVLFATTF